jgi:outer membrane protein OmpA-like peptidoglycan-associated protein
MSHNPFPNRRAQLGPASEEHWIPLSDLMSGLMMMFMLVAVLFMIQVESESRNVRALKDKAEAEALRAQTQAERMRDVADIYRDMREALYRDLYTEFASDLPRWGAELDPDSTIQFKAPDLLFENRKSELPQKFAAILDDFFPRYLKILSSDAYRNSIEEIRIEGHTSSVWNSLVTADKAYLLNMELSQSRTRAVLEHVLAEPRPADLQRWLVALLTANGLSSSKLRTNPDGTENQEASRRVEFRVRTNAEARIEDVLKAARQ